MGDRDAEHQPRHIISAAARLANLHPQTLRHYERLGLVSPQRTRGKARLYSDRDVEQLVRIQRLMNELGVNLAAVEVILRMREQILSLQAQVAELNERLGTVPPPSYDQPPLAQYE